MACGQACSLAEKQLVVLLCFYLFTCKIGGGRDITSDRLNVGPMRGEGERERQRESERVLKRKRERERQERGERKRERER